MRFNPNYKTSDGRFEIECVREKLTKKTRPPEPNFVNKNITYNVITCFNCDTYSLSTKSLYVDKQNRLYFKDNKGNKYYIDELIDWSDE